jgi:hypothetical protein
MNDKTSLKLSIICLAIFCFAKTGWDIDNEHYIVAFLQLGLGIFNIGLFFRIEIVEHIKEKMK